MREEELDTTYLPKPRVYPPTSAYLPAGQSVDWSFAGYHDAALGVDPPPSPPVLYDVRRFGARGDDEADDTAALQFAVAAANAKPGVVFLPAGTYRLSLPLTVTAPGVVIRGEGEGTTRIVITRALADVHPGSWNASGGERAAPRVGHNRRSPAAPACLLPARRSAGPAQQSACPHPLRCRGVPVGIPGRLHSVCRH